MSRLPAFLLGPELVLAVLSAGVFWYCARHNSGEGRDTELMSRLVMLLPLLMVPAAFATVIVPGATTWGWLVRTIIFSYVCVLVCAGRAIAGFGMGPRGQDAAFIMALGFGTVLIAIGTAVTGAMILAGTRPAFAAWFGARKLLGSFLTALASLPIGIGLGLASTMTVALLASVYTAFKR